MTGHIEFQIEDSVARITLDNQTKRNAISQSMWQDLDLAFKDIRSNSRLRCVVLRGAGGQAFSSGGDIEEFESLRSSKALAIEFGRICHHAMQAVQDCPIPTVAAIRGFCVGGGLELAAHCDMRIACDDSKYGVPIAKLGGVLAYPELMGLLRLVGENTALELLLEGRIFGANEALQKGLVNRVMPAAAFDADVEATVSRIVSNAPLSAKTHKRFLARLRPYCPPLQASEFSEGYDCFDSADFITGYRAFLTKTKPAFEGK